MQLPQIVEIKGIRVLTSKQIAEGYETTTDTIKKNFTRNRSRFIQGKHYICLTGKELRDFKNKVTNCHPVNNEAKNTNQDKNERGNSCLVEKNARILYLWTEKGALLHAKSLNTDKAWEVYDYLVDHYFRTQGQQAPKVKETKLEEIKKAPAPMWTNGRLTPAKALVSNVPDNSEAQKLITDMRRYLAGMDALLDIYNMYNKEDDLRKITEVIDRMSSKIIWVSSEIRRFKPKFVEKFI